VNVGIQFERRIPFAFTVSEAHQNQFENISQFNKELREETDTVINVGYSYQNKVQYVAVDK
jgi:predicted membrane-bound dolichyl-phosphate-mannose-protein mannosyltransferase